MQPTTPANTTAVPTHTPADKPTDPAATPLQDQSSRLADLEGVFLKRAQDGDTYAVEQVLAIQRQRAALLGIPLAAPPPRSVGAKTASTRAAKDVRATSPTVRVVVEFLDDWRTA